MNETKFIGAYLYSSRKKGLDHHVTKAALQYHLNDLLYFAIVAVIWLSLREDQFVELQKKCFVSSVQSSTDHIRFMVSLKIMFKFVKV